MIRYNYSTSWHWKTSVEKISVICFHFWQKKKGSLAENIFVFIVVIINRTLILFQLNSCSRGTKKESLPEKLPGKYRVEKVQESIELVLGKLLKPICQVRTDNLADSTLNFLQNLKIDNRSTILSLTENRNGNAS